MSPKDEAVTEMPEIRKALEAAEGVTDPAAAEAAGLEEARRFLAEHPEIGSIDAIFVDLNSIVRGKRYPREDLAKLYKSGLQVPYSAFLLDVTGESLDPKGMGFSDGDPDGSAFPVPGTLVPVPWAKRPRAQVLMSFREDDPGHGWADPRNLAARSLKRFLKRGLRPVVAFEVEFYLLEQERDPKGRPQIARSPETGRRETVGQVYSLSGLDDFDPFFAATEAACRAQNIPSSVATSEYAPGQFEINLRHQEDALVAADHCALLRHLVQRVADSQGMRATFIPKPFAEQTGSGMHIHLSLIDEEGRNVFDDGSPLGSEILRHAIGGMAAALPESMAFFSPHINGYRRFGPNLFVPVAKSWGANNRSFAFRLPAGPSSARRIEHRVAGADANPYLVLAVLLEAIAYGLDNRIDPGPPWKGNATAEVDPDLPLFLLTALERLEAGEILKAGLGERYVQVYAEAKRREWEKFMTHVSSLEYDWYL